MYATLLYIYLKEGPSLSARKTKNSTQPPMKRAFVLFPFVRVFSRQLAFSDLPERKKKKKEPGRHRKSSHQTILHTHIYRYIVALGRGVIFFVLFY